MVIKPRLFYFLAASDHMTEIVSHCIFNFLAYRLKKILKVLLLKFEPYKRSNNTISVLFVETQRKETVKNIIFFALSYSFLPLGNQTDLT